MCARCCSWATTRRRARATRHARRPASSRSPSRKGLCQDRPPQLNFAHPDIVHIWRSRRPPERDRPDRGGARRAQACRRSTFTVVAVTTCAHRRARARLVVEFGKARDRACRWIETTQLPLDYGRPLVPARPTRQSPRTTSRCSGCTIAPPGPSRSGSGRSRTPSWPGGTRGSAAGAELVREVAPFEAMKIRLSTASFG